MIDVYVCCDMKEGTERELVGSKTRYEIVYYVMKEGAGRKLVGMKTGY